MILVPYYVQEKDYTCGPASLRMVFNFWGMEFDEFTLEKCCKSKPIIGTSHENMVKCVRKLGFKVHVKKGCSFQELMSYLIKGKPVILNYINPISKCGHYAVVKCYDSNNFILADPQNGDNYIVSKAYLRKNWHNSKSNSKNWMIVIINKK